MTRPHTVAVIHARGGSKRVPLKNIVPLGGKPLIAWCIEALLAAECLDRVIVSTDHDGIAAAAREAGAEVPFTRPADISEDVPSELVTQHAIRFHEEETGREVDIAVTVQPTTPFIRSEDVDGCIGLVRDNPQLDSSFTAYPVHERPEWMFRRDESGRMTSYVQATLQGDMGVSQTLEPLYHPNGGVYATRRNTLFNDGLLIGGKPGGWAMSRLRSVDIDDPVDVLIAETVAGFLADHPEA